MPTLNATVEVDEAGRNHVEVEFEVFCGRCGGGLCNSTTTRSSRFRGQPQAVVEPCEKCMNAERQEGYTDGVDSREDEVSDLKDQLRDLSDELSDARRESHE